MYNRKLRNGAGTSVSCTMQMNAISEELVYAPNHRIDPEYEELDEAITWDNRYIVPMMTYLTYRLQTGQIAEKMPRIETAVSGGYSCM